ncbi:xylanase/chitin deacetylase [Penicillium capsulatum]|uniref:Xylanase/chitin deacetylase n=1 Tax=Penicillium capsulatum TaxID=69766 RepID=A0A9W9HZM9_9EURO|nr:xylanase/chitin deacetylase [Penicillium capsulatum]KAJ6117216.1 xylanase/chitin deacetylase [Penicillium capsulatum]
MPGESPSQPLDFGLAGKHVLIAGLPVSIGGDVVREFLGDYLILCLMKTCGDGCLMAGPDHNCYVTIYDSRLIHLVGIDEDRSKRLKVLCDVDSIESSVYLTQFGPARVLIIGSDSETYSSDSPIMKESPVDWELENHVHSQLTSCEMKFFLEHCLKHGVANTSIILVDINAESSLGRFQSSLDIPALCPGGRINAIEVDSSRIGDESIRLEDVAKSLALLASSRLSRNTSGQTIRVEPKEHPELPRTRAELGWTRRESIPRALAKPKRNKIRVAVSIDLDAVSGWLGSNSHPDNNLADYSAGFFAARVGVPRLLRMLKKLNIAQRCTWFIPGHSAESFPEEVKQVVESGCEVGLHGYAHEGAYQLTPEQERDVLVRCIEISKKLTGKKPIGYRAPLYQLRESTLDLLEEFGFEYGQHVSINFRNIVLTPIDASLTDHDCHPFFAPRRPPLQPIDFSKPASTWMHPIQEPSSPPDRRPLVCVPCNYYMEDMTPMQFLPHTGNSHGYVDVRLIENMWRDRFLWIRDNEEEPVFPILMHPDTSGMAHVIGMLERMLRWLKDWEEEGEVEFLQTGEIARWWREKMLAEDDC